MIGYPRDAPSTYAVATTITCSAAASRSRSSLAVCAVAALDQSVPAPPATIAAVKLPLPASFRKLRRSADLRLSVVNVLSSLDGFMLRYFFASASFLRIAMTNKTATLVSNSISPTSFRNAEFDVDPRPTFTAKITSNTIAPISGMSRILPVAHPILISCKPLHLQNASLYIHVFNFELCTTSPNR